MDLKSKWGEELDRLHPLPEYPRMLMQRNSFTNLNGIWEYQILPERVYPMENDWHEIVVPFPLGSLLSESPENLNPGFVLWYRLRFPYEAKEKHTLLHFEAVDQCCSVYFNGQLVGSHQGGYAPFSFEVTSLLKKKKNEILLMVTDESDAGDYAFGKQRLKHGGMWYTPCAGIWQTVWMEDISDHAVTDLEVSCNFDRKSVTVKLEGDFAHAMIIAAAKGQLVYQGVAEDKTCTFTIDTPHVWSPEDPFLYDLYVQTEDDIVKSYFAMRKVSREVDQDGIARFCLNNRPLFLSGLLDQGLSCDGNMTYPSDDQMVFEISSCKALGFNMLRKHVKVEMQRWYYHCDRLGMLVIQDMPNGGRAYDLPTTKYLPHVGVTRLNDHNNPRFGRADEALQKLYYKELDDMLKLLKGHPSIVIWTAFNEGWGQFEAPEVCEHIRAVDNSRLIDAASGWHDQGCGDFYSRHLYFTKNVMPKKLDYRILLLSEFGGYAYVEPEHCQVEKLYGYKTFRDRPSFEAAFLQIYDDMILPYIRKGLCGCVYTQVSDVEDEANGLFTADRKVLKVSQKRTRMMNERCCRRLRNTGLITKEDI